MLPPAFGSRAEPPGGRENSRRMPAELSGKDGVCIAENLAREACKTAKFAHRIGAGHAPKNEIVD
jgi:hypothetical protein